MKRTLCHLLVLIAVLELSQSNAVAQEAESSTPAPPLVGSETEKRFPPLVVPDGFSATLFACDPLIEYPSVISIGPRPGTLFVAHDYVTGLGVEIVRRDEVRLIDDTDGDGYADRSTVFADGFNSIQGLAFDDGNVFVMHAPLLTLLRDTDGDAVADWRRDLIAGLGLPPEENSNRLHCANGVVAGHDGWLYLSVGDRGCDVNRPEGDRLLFQQGGILRCRFDGTDLHVFSTGLRNIYDVALDPELNVFVRDNENDGGDYMIRVCHCFFGSDHGYPYHYYERPGELMPPLADLGRGSSAGGTSYLETAFPKEFRESLFFCEWGRAVVRYRKTRHSSSFQQMAEIDFAAGATTDPYGFKPTDLVVDHDGSLLVSDWADGQRPKRGRGRIYRISYEQKPASPASQESGAPLAGQGDVTTLIRQLDAASYLRRRTAQVELLRAGTPAIDAAKAAMQTGKLGSFGRQHLVWMIARSGNETALTDLLAMAESDDDPRVSAQAVRAIGDLTDPILVENRVAAGRGDVDVAQRIAALAQRRSDPQVVLEALIVMRRLQWTSASDWIATNLTADDPAINHAATAALRYSQNWPGVAALLDRTPRLRRLALHAMAEQRIEFVADELIRRLDQTEDPQLASEYADALSRIVRQTKPWEYWGFRPAPRPAATVNWAKTTAVIAALNAQLADSDFDVRSLVLKRMMREGAAPDLAKLADWLREESDEARVDGILKALETIDAKEVQPLLIESVGRRTWSNESRLKALAVFIEGPGFIEGQAEQVDSRLLALGSQLEDGPVLAAVLRELGRQKKLDGDGLLLEKLDSTGPLVRAEAIRALGRRRTTEASERVAKLLIDPSRDVRLAASEAAGLLAASESASSLLKLAATTDGPLVNASLLSLRQLRDGRAIDAAIAALGQSESQLSAVRYLSDFAEPDYLDPVVSSATTNLSTEYQRAVAQLITAWDERYPEAHSVLLQAMADVHGQSGEPLVWRISRFNSNDEAASFLERLADPLDPPNPGDSNVVETRLAKGAAAEIQLTADSGSENSVAWVAWSPIRVSEETAIEVLSSATGALSVWLNGQQQYRRESPGGFQLDSDRIRLVLLSGMNVIAVQVQSDDKPPRFHLRFRRRSSKAKQEQLAQFAVRSKGNADRGRQVFESSQKTACINCHRMGDKGGLVGPDLSGIGRRFSRIHLVESILDPSRSVAPSYATITVLLGTGHVVTGVRVSESDSELVIGDNQGKTHTIRKADIDEVANQTTSIMPEGLEEQLTDRQFADLLAFLESMKQSD